MRNRRVTHIGIYRLIAACLLLAGCSESGFLFPEQSQKPAVEQVLLDGGGISLQAPDGYCIDPDTLGARFALLARCDTLGMVQKTAAMPLGVITVSLAPAQSPAPRTDMQEVAASFHPAADAVQVMGKKTVGRTVFLKLRGSQEIAEGLSNTHWRGATRMGSYTIGVAFYGGAETRLSRDEGADILTSLITRTRAATKDLPPKVQTPQIRPPVRTTALDDNDRMASQMRGLRIVLAHLSK